MNNSSEDIAAASARVARQLAELATMSGVGLALCREILAKMQSAEGLSYDPGLAYSRISRAVRLTLALESRIAEEHQQALAGKAKVVREDRVTKVKAVVLEVLKTAIEAEYKTNPDCNRELLAELHDSLPEIISELEDERGEDLYAKAPIPVIIAMISETLKVPVDWSLWQRTGWIKEDWQPDGMDDPPDDHPAEIKPDTEPVFT